MNETIDLKYLPPASNIYSFWLHLFKISSLSSYIYIYMHLFSLCIHGSNAGCLIRGGPDTGKGRIWGLNGCRILRPGWIEGWTGLGGSMAERVLTFASWVDRVLNGCWVLRPGWIEGWTGVDFCVLRRLSWNVETEDTDHMVQGPGSRDGATSFEGSHLQRCILLYQLWLGCRWIVVRMCGSGHACLRLVPPISSICSVPKEHSVCSTLVKLSPDSSCVVSVDTLDWAFFR